MNAHIDDLVLVVTHNMIALGHYFTTVSQIPCGHEERPYASGRPLSQILISVVISAAVLLLLHQLRQVCHIFHCSFYSSGQFRLTTTV